jgi:16S rRNA G966 N2-methylase RsmD
VTLNADQQLKLVRQLIKDRDKAKFKSQAEYFRVENDMVKEAERQLKGIPEEYLAQAVAEVRKGRYGKEYLAHGKQPGPAFLKLLQSLKDAYQGTQNYRCFHGDFQEVGQTLEPESVDVILTDPPYGKDWLPQVEALGELAARVLKPGGSLFVMYGQSFTMEALILLSHHLDFHWIISYYMPGGQSVSMWSREINVFWKPVLWFVKGTHTGNWIGDVAKSAVNDNDKRFDAWGQSESGMADLVERFTSQGELILDPCMGAGTTGVAALSRRRQFIGIDRDEAKVATAESRLKAVAEQLQGEPLDEKGV